jgi:tripartite motif-containing protein 71
MLETLTSALIVATTCLPFIPMAEVSVRQERTETTSDSEPVVAPVPALGAFDQELNGIRQGEQAMLLPGGAGTVVLSSGRSITVLDPTVEGEVTRERSVSGAFTAVCIRPNGDLVAFEEVLGELRVWSPSLDGPVLREVARVKLDQSRTETLVDVVDMTPFQDGYLLVERGAHRVRALDAQGNERFRFGRQGGGDGAFQFPGAVAVDAEDRIYVVDTDNHRIQRFTPEGDFDVAWGRRGAFPGLLTSPTGIDVVGERLYVSEALNHRISVFDLDGRYLYQWGMHAMIPRQGEGRIHYPASIDVDEGATRAVVAEPFERRIQYFNRFPGGMEEARAAQMPSKQDIRSHFGPFISGEDDLLVMGEPESGSIAVFDVAGETGVNITVFTNHGSGWDDLGRLGALHLDGDEQMIYVSDLVNDRLCCWRLERAPDTTIRYDPFMARLASAVDLSVTREKLARLQPDRAWVVPRIVALDRAQVPGAPLLAADAANQVVFALDERLDPISVGAATRHPFEFMVDGPRVVLIERSGKASMFRPLALDGSDPGVKTELGGMLMVSNGAPGGATLLGDACFLSSPEGDQIEVIEGAGAAFENLLAASSFQMLEGDDQGRDPIEPTLLEPTPERSWGVTGEYDGEFYAPAGLCRIAGDRIVVVDRGNHRAQIFRPDGTWLSTFSLSSGYTKPKPRRETP